MNQNKGAKGHHRATESFEAWAAGLLALSSQFLGLEVDMSWQGQVSGPW